MGFERLLTGSSKDSMGSAVTFGWVQSAEYVLDAPRLAKIIGVMRTQHLYAGSAPEIKRPI
jgi:hypothetical protein